MEHQKIIHLLGDTTNQSSEFKTRNWVEMNDSSRGAYNDDDDYNSIKFKSQR